MSPICAACAENLQNSTALVMLDERQCDIATDTFMPKSVEPRHFIVIPTNGEYAVLCFFQT